MSKRSRSKKSPSGDLQICYEVAFTPDGVLFSSIGTPESVLVNLCPDHAANFVWHLGLTFINLPRAQIKTFDNSLLRFVDYLLKNPHEAGKYELPADLDDYFCYLAGKQEADQMEAPCYEREHEKSTLH